MIRFSAMYPNTPGARFDHAYYRDKHMALVKTRMGDSCVSYSVDKGLGGFPPGTPAPYVAVGHIIAESMESFFGGMGPHVPEIMADVANFTDIVAVVQFSEVVA